MKVRVINTKQNRTSNYIGRELYEFTCATKACDYCPFRFKCYTERGEFDITTDELDDLSLRWVSGKELLELIHERRTNQFYYQSLFYKITRERIMDVGFIPLLTKVSI